MPYEEALRFLDGCAQNFSSQPLRDGCRAAANALKEIDELRRAAVERSKRVDDLQAKNTRQADHVHELIDELEGANALIANLREILRRDEKNMKEQVEEIGRLREGLAGYHHTQLACIGQIRDALGARAPLGKNLVDAVRDLVREADQAEARADGLLDSAKFWSGAHEKTVREAREALGAEVEDGENFVGAIKRLVREAGQAKAQVDAMRPAHDANERAFQTLGIGGFRGTLVERAAEAVEWKTYSQNVAKFWEDAYEKHTKAVREALGDERGGGENAVDAIKRLVAEVQELHKDITGVYTEVAQALGPDRNPKQPVMDNLRAVLAKHREAWASVRDALGEESQYQYGEEPTDTIKYLVAEVRDLRAKADEQIPTPEEYLYEWRRQEDGRMGVYNKITGRCHFVSFGTEPVRCGKLGAFMAALTGVDDNRLDPRHPDEREKAGGP